MITTAGCQRVTAAVMDASEITLPGSGLISFSDGKTRPLTFSAFVQLLYFMKIN